MTFELILTLVVLVAVVVALAWERISAEIVMLTALLVLITGRVVSIEDALDGFANEGVITIAALFVIGAGLQATGAVEYLSGILLGRPKQGANLLRLFGPVAGLSGFMNNTPLVAFMLPIFVNVAKKLRVSPSKLLIPLSYAAILGGTCTLIGTSTNLVIQSVVTKTSTATLHVAANSPLVGKSLADIEQAHPNLLTDAGLRLTGLQTAERHYTPAPRDLLLSAGDRLRISGDLHSSGDAERRQKLAELGTVFHLQMQEQQAMPGLGMFELTWIGFPVTIAGLIYLVTFGQKLLPSREDLLEYAGSHPREYTVELIVRPQCPLVGKSIRASGLRDMPGLYLYAIERGGERLAPVEPSVRLEVDDLLCFSGVVSHVVDLQKVRGLDPVEHGDRPPAETDSLDSMEGVPSSARAAPRTGRQLCEVVIAPRSPLVGLSVKDADFRARYQASIMAVHRSGQKLSQKIGQIVLQSGDTLLVDAGDDFLRRWRNSPDFILVSGLEDSAPVAHHRAWLALAIFAAVVIGMSLATKQAVLISLVGAALIVVAGCLSPGQAYRAVEIPVLLLVAAALGVGKALDTSGAAEWIAGGLVYACEPLGPIAVLAAFVIITGLLTELLSNNATAALMGALALAAAAKMGMNPRPLLIAVALSASYGFATPIGYQTNLMVLNPGGYRFRDFLKVGIPLDIICWTLTILLVPLVWNLLA